MQVDDLGATITKQNMFVGGSVIVKRQSQAQVSNSNLHTIRI